MAPRKSKVSFPAIACVVLVLVILGLLIWLLVQQPGNTKNGNGNLDGSRRLYGMKKRQDANAKRAGRSRPRRQDANAKRAGRSRPRRNGLAKAPKKKSLMQSRNSCVSRGSRDFTMPNSAADVDYVPRPPDQAHFNKLNPNKFYGASNAVPHPNAGYEMTNCAYKNLTVQDDKDPILGVADLLPSQTLNKEFIENTDLTTFPVGNAYPSLARSAYMNCIQVDRSQISERTGLQHRVGAMDLLRNWGQVYLNRGSEVTAAAKADKFTPSLMFGASSDFLSFAELGETTPTVPGTV
jgi:hypothetical protein